MSAVETGSRLGVALRAVVWVALLWCGLAVLAPARGLYFHGDDFEWLDACAKAQHLGPLALPDDVNGHFRPLAEALWRVEWPAFGLRARSYHTVTLLLHLAAALAAGFVAWRLTGELDAAAAAGLLFLVNAAHRTVPLWVSAAPDLLLGLAAAATLAGLLARPRWRWLGAVGFVLALLAKETGLLLAVMVPLAVPEVLRWSRIRVVLLAATTALVVPHAVAALLSPYVRGRFHATSAAAGGLAEMASALLVPASSQAAHHGARVAAGLVLLAAMTALAGRTLGRSRALAWTLAALIALVPAAFASDGVEPRWLYLPWVLVAPLAAAALVAARRMVAARGWPRLAALLLPAALAAHVATHGALVSAKVARDLERDRWVRGIVEGAAAGKPPLADGDRVEVIVPFGAELRAWPLGVRLAVGRSVDVVPIDDRTAPTPGVAVLDATTVPARWR